MKGLKLKLILVLAAAAVVAYFGLSPCFAETIYTKDGQEIQAKITEITEDTVWYEITTGDMIEYTGIDISDIEKILNDDGSLYEEIS